MNNTPLNIGSLDDLVQQTDSITARYKLYNGEIELLYDDDEHTYCTEVDGERIPAYGVTSVTGCADKPALKPWVAKETVEDLRRKIRPYLVKSELSELIQISPEQFEKLLTEAKAAYKNISQKALDVGHIAHEFIEDYLKAHIKHGVNNPEPFVPTELLDGVTERILRAVPEDEPERESKIEQCIRAIDGGVKWLKAHNFRPIKAEYKLYSRDYNFAGTTDAKGHMDSCSDPECCKFQFKDWLVIADWKSSRDFYIEYRYQASAYNQADYEESGDVKDANVVVILGKYDGIVRGFIIPASDQADDFGAFLGLLAFYERGETLGTIERLHKQIAKADKKAAKEAQKASEKAAKVAERLRKKAEKTAKKPKKELVQ